MANDGNASVTGHRRRPPRITSNCAAFVGGIRERGAIGDAVLNRLGLGAVTTFDCCPLLEVQGEHCLSDRAPAPPVYLGESAILH